MPTAENNADHAEPRAPGGPTPLRVLLLAGRAERGDALRAALDRQAPGSRIETADNVVDAMLRSARTPADLMLLDLAADATLAPALLRHLARIAPATTVLVFDDLAPSVAGHAEVWPWHQLDAALQHWLRRRG